MMGSFEWCATPVFARDRRACAKVAIERQWSERQWRHLPPGRAFSSNGSKSVGCSFWHSDSRLFAPLPRSGMAHAAYVGGCDYA